MDLEDLPHDLLDPISNGQIRGVPPEKWCFLDTETTGLAGGSGTYAFLVGVGRITPQGFRVRQFFMRDFGEEASQLSALTEHLKQFEVLITYNGRTYDQPLLETRFRMVRQRPPFSSLEHLDLLFGARRLWNLRFDSCRLVELENQILGVERQGDLPGELIPYVYFEYVRTHEIFRLLPVFHHNAIDILTLACLTAIVPRAFHRLATPSFRTAPKWWAWRAGGGKPSSMKTRWRCFARPSSKNLSDELLFRTLWDIAALEKKLGREHAALPVLTDLAASRNPWRAAAFVELAKYYERRERNYALALEMTRSALELEPSEALERRAARLEKRVDVPKTSRLDDENISAVAGCSDFVLSLTSCAKSPKLDVSLSLDKQNADLIFVKVKVVNTEDRATVPIAIEVTGQDGNQRPLGQSQHAAASGRVRAEPEGAARDHQAVESSSRRRANHPDRQRTGTWIFVKNRTRGKSLCRLRPVRASYSKALSSLQASPCDSATPGCVMCPAYVFTPTRIAALSRQACSSPLAHNSAR